MTSSLSKNEPGAIIDFSIEQLQLCRGAVLSLSNHMPRRHATKTGESDGAMELLNKSETPKWMVMFRRSCLGGLCAIRS